MDDPQGESSPKLQIVSSAVQRRRTEGVASIPTILLAQTSREIRHSVGAIDFDDSLELLLTDSAVELPSYDADSTNTERDDDVLIVETDSAHATCNVGSPQDLQELHIHQLKPDEFKSAIGPEGDAQDATATNIPFDGTHEESTEDDDVLMVETDSAHASCYVGSPQIVQEPHIHQLKPDEVKTAVGPEGDTQDATSTNIPFDVMHEESTEVGIKDDDVLIVETDSTHASCYVGSPQIVQEPRIHQLKPDEVKTAAGPEGDPQNATATNIPFDGTHEESTEDDDVLIVETDSTHASCNAGSPQIVQEPHIRQLKLDEVKTAGGPEGDSQDATTTDISFDGTHEESTEDDDVLIVETDSTHASCNAGSPQIVQEPHIHQLKLDEAKTTGGPAGDSQDATTTDISFDGTLEESTEDSKIFFNETDKPNLMATVIFHDFGVLSTSEIPSNFENVEFQSAIPSGSLLDEPGQADNSPEKVENDQDVDSVEANATVTILDTDPNQVDAQPSEIQTTEIVPEITNHETAKFLLRARHLFDSNPNVSTDTALATALEGLNLNSSERDATFLSCSDDSPTEMSPKSMPSIPFTTRSTSSLATLFRRVSQVFSQSNGTDENNSQSPSASDIVEQDNADVPPPAASTPARARLPEDLLNPDHTRDSTITLTRTSSYSDTSETVLFDDSGELSNQQRIPSLVAKSASISQGTQYERQPDLESNPLAYGQLFFRSPKVEEFSTIRPQLDNPEGENGNLTCAVEEKSFTPIKVSAQNEQDSKCQEELLQAVKCSVDIQDKYGIACERIHQMEEKYAKLQQNYETMQKDFEEQTAELKAQLMEKEQSLADFDALKIAYDELQKEMDVIKPHSVDLVKTIDTLIMEKEKTCGIMLNNDKLVASLVNKCSILKAENEIEKKKSESIQCALKDVVDKFDKAKTVLRGMKANENIYISHINLLQEKLNSHHTQYEIFKKEAMSKLDKASQQYSKLQEQVGETKEPKLTRQSSSKSLQKKKPPNK